MKNNNKLIAYRKLHDLTQKDTAKLLNISNVAYSLKESGQKDFKLSEAKFLADYFGTTVDEIFFNNSVNFKLT